MNIIKIAKTKFISTYQLAKKYDQDVKSANKFLSNFSDVNNGSIEDQLQSISNAYIISNVSLSDNSDIPDNIKENISTADTKEILMYNGSKSIYVISNSSKKFLAILSDRSSKSNNTMMFAYTK
jgi:hypothetical protein